jgi:hypothetical protein
VWAILGALLIAPFALLVFNTFSTPADLVAIPPLQSEAVSKGFEGAEMPALSVTAGDGVIGPVSVTSMEYSTCTTTSYGIEDDPRLRLFEEL